MYGPGLDRPIGHASTAFPTLSLRGTGPFFKPTPREQRLAEERRKLERAAAKFARKYGSKAYVAWIKSHPCAGCGRRFPIEAAHVSATGAGGVKGDARVIVPLCTYCHRLHETSGWSAFTRRTGVSREDLLALAERLYRTFHGEDHDADRNSVRAEN